MATNTVLRNDTPVLSAQGIFHDLDIYPDRLIIRPNDIFSRLLGSEEVISYNDIRSLHAYNSYFLINNWSQLIIVCKNGKSRALTYGTRQRHIAQHVKETIEDFLSRREIAPLMKSG